MNDLVERLSQKNRSVSFKRPEQTATSLKQRIELGYVHILFDETGTELNIRLNKDLCDLSSADFEKNTGSVMLQGGITLNYVKVKCICSLDLNTLKGKGHLVPLGDEEYAKLMEKDLVN